LIDNSKTAWTFERYSREVQQPAGPQQTTVAVARKLLTLVYYGLRDGHIRALQTAKAAA
jgi:hypothetical protein